MRATGILQTITVEDPMAIASGGPTQVAMSPTLAAGMPQIITVGQPGGRIGPPTCGGGVTKGHVCMSPTLAAGGINQLLSEKLEQEARSKNRRTLPADHYLLPASALNTHLTLDELSAGESVVDQIIGVFRFDIEGVHRSKDSLELRFIARWQVNTEHPWVVIAKVQRFSLRVVNHNEALEMPPEFLQACRRLDQN